MSDSYSTPAAMDHPDTVRRGHLRRRSEQGRLADSGLTRQHERRTTLRHGTEEGIEGAQLAIATDQAVGPGREINHPSVTPSPSCPLPTSRIRFNANKRPATGVPQSFDRCCAHPSLSIVMTYGEARS